MKKILTVTLCLVMSVLAIFSVGCAKNKEDIVNNLTEARYEVEYDSDKEYIAYLVSVVLTGGERVDDYLFEPECFEWVVEGYHEVLDEECMVFVFKCTANSIARDIAKQARRNKDDIREIFEGENFKVKRSGSLVFIGQKQAIRAAR